MGRILKGSTAKEEQNVKEEIGGWFLRKDIWEKKGNY